MDMGGGGGIVNGDRTGQVRSGQGEGIVNEGRTGQVRTGGERV